VVALLPDRAVSIEIGGSWRQLETLGALGAWAVLGLTVAPIVPSRIAHREPGSHLTKRREKLLQRIG